MIVAEAVIYALHMKKLEREGRYQCPNCGQCRRACHRPRCPTGPTSDTATADTEGVKP